MGTLEDIRNGTLVSGVPPNQAVKVVSVKWIGAQAINLFYRVPRSSVAASTLFCDDEHHLSVEPRGRACSFDAALKPSSTGPMLVRGVYPVTRCSVVGAIRCSCAIELKHRSLSSPETRWRWIATHAIAFDGCRWHARAFCQTDEIFKDFLLSRILDIRGSRERDTAAENDCDWHTEVGLEVCRHPDLSETQAKVIARDYRMRGGKAKSKIWCAFLYYALRWLGLDTDLSRGTNMTNGSCS